MKLMLLMPGTGHFYCGSCLRDDALAKALRRLGHDVVVVPLYMPRVLEDPTGDPAVHMGGINLYLQQKTRLARFLPRWLASLLDRPGLLRRAARCGGLTDASALGAMTLSMLQGESGHQAVALEEFARWAGTVDRPDVIVLSNVILSGMVRRLKQVLDRPVVATMQGEAPFLDALPEPYAARSWQELTRRVADIDAFVPVSHSYGALMCERLELDADRVHVVHNGLDFDDLPADPAPLAGRRPKAIGYLARMCSDKGLDTLVDAFCHLKENGRVDGLRLRVAGTMLREDRPFVRDLQSRLRARGWERDADFLPNLERGEKLAFLRTLSVFSVPATYGESFGLYLLEAMAAGVPVVQPRHAAFPELIEASGGGILCDPADSASLASGLEELLLDQVRSQELAERGRRSVTGFFTTERMAREFEAVCMAVASRPSERPAPASDTERER